MIETIIGIVFAVIGIAVAVQANKEHMDATGVPMPYSNAQRWIRRNARKKGISEDQAYATWLAWHQKNRGVTRHSAGLAQTSTTGVTGYTAKELAKLQRDMADRRLSESELKARRAQDEIERWREAGNQTRMQIIREQKEREARELAERIAKARKDAEDRLRKLGSSVTKHVEQGERPSRIEELRTKLGVSFANVDQGEREWRERQAREHAGREAMRRTDAEDRPRDPPVASEPQEPEQRRSRIEELRAKLGVSFADNTGERGAPCI
ncbi:hypothetical protein JOD31_000666 [Methylopila capsulata]|uniref:Uncharacterized protein n=1 Tax=Methylopila capsulata TaxID=61654 RepID=A0A9W6IT75_9HYPH|nr:hypothetical protein [Methylopila capsulata]MBM7850454.1 hypothetical protein [Methylopila capsulata]GLK55748.1 hypothetical protein GCM10008170_17670 [Methylopila capsulata]